MQYVYGHDEAVADFVAQLIPHCRERGFGTCKAIGVADEEGALIGGVIYHNYDPEAGVIEISGGAINPRWLTRKTIAHMYQYPFLQLGVQMIVQRTPADDERLLRQLAAYGYMFVKVPRMFGRDRDGVLCLLTVEDWENNRFNKRLRHHLAVDHPDAKEAA
jgi:RimJ/RimL family protein N-acetyltransferase